MEFDEELDYEPDAEDYVNNLLYATNEEQIDPDLNNQNNHQINCNDNGISDDKDEQTVSPKDNEVFVQHLAEEVDDKRDGTNDEHIGSKSGKQLKNKRKDKMRSHLSPKHSKDSDKIQTKSCDHKEKKKKKKKKSRTKDRDSFVDLKEQNSKCVDLLSDPVISSVNRQLSQPFEVKNVSNESHLEEDPKKTIINISSQELIDRYDSEGVCEGCQVVLPSYSKQLLDRAVKGQVSFIFEERQESEEDSHMDQFNESNSMMSPEINFSDHHFEEQFSQTHKFDKNPKNKIKRVERKRSTELRLSESSSEEQEEELKIKEKAISDSQVMDTEKSENRVSVNLIIGLPSSESEPNNDIKKIKNKSIKSKPKTVITKGLELKSGLDLVRLQNLYRNPEPMSEPIPETNNKCIEKDDKYKKILKQKCESKKRKMSNKLIGKPSMSSSLDDIEYNNYNNRELTNKEIQVLVDNLPDIGTESYQFKCPLNDCQFVTTEELELVLHSMVHIDDNLKIPTAIECCLCPLFFVDNESLDSHVAEVHLGLNNKTIN